MTSQLVPGVNWFYFRLPGDLLTHHPVESWMNVMTWAWTWRDSEIIFKWIPAARGKPLNPRWTSLYSSRCFHLQRMHRMRKELQWLYVWKVWNFKTQHAFSPKMVRFGTCDLLGVPDARCLPELFHCFEQKSRKRGADCQTCAAQSETSVQGQEHWKNYFICSNESRNSFGTDGYFWAIHIIHHPWSPKSSHEMLAKSAGRQHFVKGQPPRCFGAENSKVLRRWESSRRWGFSVSTVWWGGIFCFRPTRDVTSISMAYVW